MVSEQFIQDALSRPSRLQRVLAELGRNDWHFAENASADRAQLHDVVNQEVSFEKGRIDILATFSNRSQLVIVEVKAGVAGLEALNQLKRYLEGWRMLPLDSMGLSKVHDDQVIGIVLAEGFVAVPDTPPNVALVAFKFAGTAWPFRVVPPAETLADGLEEEPTPATAKASGLYSLADHRDYLRSPDLRSAYQTVAGCFLDSTDKRSEWLLANVKGSHIALHYKGEYLIHLWAKQNYFYVGYDLGAQPRWIKVAADNLATALPTIQRDFEQLLAVADNKLARVIPADFHWQSGM